MQSEGWRLSNLPCVFGNTERNCFNKNLTRWLSEEQLVLRDYLSMPREVKPATLFPYHVVNDVGKSPNHRDAEEGDAQEYDMQQANSKDVGQPDAPAVHDTGVGIHLAVCCSHIHVGIQMGTPETKAESGQYSDCGSPPSKLLG